MRTITRIDLCVLDTEGSLAASTFDMQNISRDCAGRLCEFPGREPEPSGLPFFKVYDEDQLSYVLLSRGTGEDAYMIGKVAVSQLQSLIVAYKERLTK